MATEIAKVDKNTSLAAAPSFMEKGDRRGLETISKEDMLIPRLSLAQMLSPECTEGDPKAIPGCKAGDFFNSVTKQLYGPGPLFLQIIRKDNPRAMQYKPLDQGGGVLDPNVPLTDDRLKWGENGEKPVATLFRDYLAVIHPSRELIALSFKSSGIKVAKQLNGLITLRNKPIFAGRYEVTSKTELKPKPHKVYIIQNADWIGGEGTGTTEADYLFGAELWEALKDVDVKIDRDAHTPEAAGDDVPF